VTLHPFRLHALSPLLVGVDGCTAGWVCVGASDDGAPQVAVFSDAAGVAEGCADASVIAVDVPIGLVDEGRRTCDCQARATLGSPRASSVFSAPIRPILHCDSQADASRRHREIDGRGFGAQAFAILSKIRQWDELLVSAPEIRLRVFEVHPEVCFWALNGNVALQSSKRRVDGRSERARLLRGGFGDGFVEEVLGHVKSGVVAPDDLLDALAALWTAKRIATGNAQSLPSIPPRDRMGIQMGMWY
jgi:predicted RNase H-like nuclease